MSTKHTLLTQAQFDALNISNDWQIAELDMATLKMTPGIQRKKDAIGSYISGSLTQPKPLNESTAVVGFDVLAHEPNPKTHRGEGSLNVYHYIIKRTGRTDFPFILSGPYPEEALLTHWPKELDLTPYEVKPTATAPMTAKCPIHGEFTLSLYSLPECPDCIRSRMVFPDGDDPKHAPTNPATISKFKSFRSDQISTTAIFNYMASGDSTNPSGCVLYYYEKEKSFNAVSLEPFGLIPGSGARNGTAWAAQFAVLQDVTGKSAKGPHFAYEEIPHLESRIQNGEWKKAPQCVCCSNAWVYASGIKCLACEQKA